MLYPAAKAAATAAAADAATPPAAAATEAPAAAAAAAGGRWRWQDEAHEDPLKPIALQAFRLEVLDEGPMGGSPGGAPTVFEAGEPWWRSEGN